MTIISHKIKTTAALSVLLLAGSSDAFAPVTTTSRRFGVQTTAASAPQHIQHARGVSVRPLYATTETQEEVERLRSMAAKLRGEAAMLEQEKAQEKAQAAAKAFQKFDQNKDGTISINELKAGLEKALKLELSETRVQRLMKEFDTNGDGVLQQEEFVGIEKFRNQLEQMFRQEKQKSLDTQKKTQAQKAAEAQLAMVKDAINDKEPTNTEKVLSVLPYLFPLMDSLQFGQFFLSQHQDNPLVQGLALVAIAYRSIPFGAFIAYFALSTLGDNLAVNKLIRFNAKQAIFLDIAQFFPSILATIVALASNAGNFQIPQSVNEMGSDAVFAAVILAIAYSSVSSLLGSAPDKIPLISDAVSQRIPSVDLFDVDDKGQIFLKDPKEEKNKDKKD